MMVVPVGRSSPVPCCCSGAEGARPGGVTSVEQKALVCLPYLVCGPLLRCLVTAHYALAELRMAKQKNPAPATVERASIDAIDPTDIKPFGAIAVTSCDGSCAPMLVFCQTMSSIALKLRSGQIVSHVKRPLFSPPLAMKSASSFGPGAEIGAACTTTDWCARSYVSGE